MTKPPSPRLRTPPGSRPTAVVYCKGCGQENAVHAMKMNRGKLVVERPCKACRSRKRRAMERAKRGLPEDAVLTTKKGTPEAKTCLGCKQYLGINNFDSYVEKRHPAPVKRWRSRCHSCDLVRRRESEKRVFDRRGWKKRKHACRICGEALTDKAGARCRPCYLKEAARQRAAYAEAHPQNKIKKPEAKQNNTVVPKWRKAVHRPGLAYMRISEDEDWVLASKCWTCKKPLLFSGRCYSCATGRERQMLRAEER